MKQGRNYVKLLILLGPRNERMDVTSSYGDSMRVKVNHRHNYEGSNTLQDTENMLIPASRIIRRRIIRISRTIEKKADLKNSTHYSTNNLTYTSINLMDM